MPGFITILSAQPAFSLSYGLLGGAIACVWWKRTPVWWTLFLIASAASGYHYGILSQTALQLIAGFWTSCYLAFYSRSRVLRVPAYFVVIVLVCMILLNYFRGFLPWAPMINLQLQNRAIPFTHHIDYAHALIGLCVLGMGAAPLIRRSPEWAIAIKDSFPIILMGIFALCTIAYNDIAIAMHFHWNGYVKFWVLCQLFFVCIAEEAIFRGMIQAPLTRLFDRWMFFKFHLGVWLAFFLTTGFYIVRHAYEGYHMMVYSSIAGLFYGYAYLKTRRIEASIFVHLIFSTVDLLAFSYPMLT